MGKGFFGAVLLVVSAFANASITAPATSTTGDYTVSWSAYAGATGYVLNENGTPFIQNTANYRIFTGKADGSYTYDVDYCFYVGWPVFGDMCLPTGYAAKTVVVDKTPAVPQPISGPTTDTDGSFAISWPSVPNANNYTLQESKDGAGYATVQNTGATSKSFSNKDDAEYRYRVRACNASGCSGFSSIHTVDVVKTPAVPGNISAPAQDTDGNFSVSWGASTGTVDNYALQERPSGGSWSTVYSGTGTSTSRSKSNGTYDYRVRACNSLSCSAFTPTVAVSVGPPPNDSNPAPAPSVAAIPPVDSASDAVGVTAGAFSVTPAGAARYTIPIFAAVGSGGFSPQLSIEYSSQASNGVFGQGTSIGGLSVISRCRQTYESDGNNAPITLSTSDRFCLDGERLVVVSGTYGAVGAEYRTEIDQFARIRSFGGSSGDPDHFIVERKGGTTSTYGGTTDSRQEAESQSEAVTWARNQLEDVAGNEIDFVYEEVNSSGEQRLRYVRYAKGGDSNPDAEIEFVYENRTDDVNWGMAGYRFNQTKRVQKIVSRNNGQELRTYNLGYQYGTHSNLSQLVSVQECNGSTCFPATTFTWANPSIGMTAESTFTHPHGFSGGQTADIDGDGIYELVYIGFDNGGSGQFKLRIMKRDGSSYSVDTSPSQEIAVDDDLLNTWTVADYNNDGKDDLLYQQGGSWRVRLGEAGPAFSASATALISSPVSAEDAVAADFNSDGLIDIAYLDSGVVRLRTLVDDPQGTATFPYEFSSPTTLTGFGDTYTHGADVLEFRPINADINGDGVTELLVKERVYGCAGQGCPSDLWSLYGSTGGTAFQRMQSASEESYYPDFNGDGYSDEAHRSGNSIWYYISNGEHLEDNTQVVILTAAQADQVQFLDYNDDGRADLLYPSGTTWRVMEYTGSGFASAYNTGILAAESASDLHEYRTVFGDFTGDGKTDAIMGHVDDDSGLNTAFPFASSSASLESNVVSRISDGFGVATDIDYLTITDPSHGSLYIPQTDAKDKSWGNGSPVFDLNESMWVVRRVERDLPTATDPNHEFVSNYLYRYGKVQAGGRGFLGFEYFYAYDPENELYTRDRFRQDFPYIGQKRETLVRRYSNAFVQRTVMNFSDKNVSGPNRKPYLRETIAEQYDFDDASLLSTVTTLVSSMDDNGNVTAMSVETDDGTDIFTRSVTNVYGDNLSNWQLGRLTNTTVVHSRSNAVGASSVTRKASFHYDASTGQLDQEVVEPGGGQAIELTTDYEFDAFGNRDLEEITGWNGSATVTRSATNVYDSDGRYIDEVRNALNQVVEETVTRDKYGSPTQVLDIDGVATDIRYGAMGREYFRRAPTGTFSESTYRLCSQVSCPASAHYRVHLESEGGRGSYVYYDILEREVRRADVGFDGTLIYLDTEYDEAGRVARKSEPYYNGSTAYWTSFTYDGVGRITQVSHPNGSTTNYDYDGFVTTRTDGLLQTRTETVNALGEVVEVVDDQGGYVKYAYNGQGNLTETRHGGPGVADAVSTFTYDLLGRKTVSDDADMGAWDYEYNAFGEITEQENALGETSTMAYDLLGRMVSRVDQSGSTTESDSAWIYDVGTNGLGKLYREDIVQNPTGPSDPADLTRTYAYDSFGRPQSVDTEIDGSTYTQSTTYDQYGRVFQRFDASGDNRGLEYTYNANGYLLAAEESRGSLHGTYEYYRIYSMDARGHVTQLRKAGMVINTQYFAQTGQPKYIYSYNALSQVLQEFDYEYDAVGNLTRIDDQSRKTGGGYKDDSELYDYDSVNRLIEVRKNGPVTATITYDSLGNIKSKTGLGTYNYNSSRPHAVASVGGTSYAYNANGSMTSGWGRSIQYNAFNKVSSVSKSGDSSSFDYGPNRHRYKRVDIKSGQATTTYYLGNVEKILRPSGDVELKRYLDGEVIATERSLNPSDELHVLKDHLGSTHVLTDDAGAMQQTMSFDAWGERRNPDTYAALSLTQLLGFDVSRTTQSYTGHEGVDHTNLVHMGGRLYDPKIGRFISGDPIIQGPLNPQNHNRYSYVLNSPLSYTDPSGYLFQEIGTAIGYVIAGGANGGLIANAIGSFIGSVIGAKVEQRVSVGVIFGKGKGPSAGSTRGGYGGGSSYPSIPGAGDGLCIWATDCPFATFGDDPIGGVISEGASGGTCGGADEWDCKGENGGRATAYVATVQGDIDAIAIKLGTSDALIDRVNGGVLYVGSRVINDLAIADAAEAFDAIIAGDFRSSVVPIARLIYTPVKSVSKVADQVQDRANVPRGGFPRNAIDGARREAAAISDLRNGAGVVLEQRTIFGANGRRAIASDGIGRRLDACRIQGGCVTEVFEITSPTEALRARKVLQIQRGNELISNPGSYVRGPNGEVIPFAPGVRTTVVTRP